jgi:hypothetical protein
MQNLVPCRFHSRALPGGQDDHGKGAGSGSLVHAFGDAIMASAWEALPKGAQALPTGSQALPTGAQALPTGWQAAMGQG